MTTNNGAGVVGSQVGLSAIKGVIPVAEGQAVLPIRCVLHDRTNDLITDIAPCGCRCRPDRPVCTINEEKVSKTRLWIKPRAGIQKTHRTSCKCVVCRGSARRFLLIVSKEEVNLQFH